jgi:hypothetical protein
MSISMPQQCLPIIRSPITSSTTLFDLKRAKACSSTPPPGAWEMS